eukprot:gene859-494_t
MASLLQTCSLTVNTSLPLVCFSSLLSFLCGVGIGANDLSANFAMVVGSGALNMKSAIMFCITFELLGAAIMGGHVSNTIRRGIVDPTLFEANRDLTVIGMTCASFSAAMWLYLSTMFGLPVSITHTVVGSIVGYALVASGGLQYVQGRGVVVIAISWVAAPLASFVATSAMFYALQRYVLRVRKMAFLRTVQVIPYCLLISLLVDFFFLIIEQPPLITQRFAAYIAPAWQYIILLALILFFCWCVKRWVVPSLVQEAQGMSNFVWESPCIRSVAPPPPPLPLVMDDSREMDPESVAAAAALQNESFRQHRGLSISFPITAQLSMHQLAAPPSPGPSPMDMARLNASASFYNQGSPSPSVAPRQRASPLQRRHHHRYNRVPPSPIHLPNSTGNDTPARNSSVQHNPYYSSTDSSPYISPLQARPTRAHRGRAYGSGPSSLRSASVPTSPRDFTETSGKNSYRSVTPLSRGIAPPTPAEEDIGPADLQGSAELLSPVNNNNNNNTVRISQLASVSTTNLPATFPAFSGKPNTSGIHFEAANPSGGSFRGAVDATYANSAGSTSHTGSVGPDHCPHHHPHCHYPQPQPQQDGRVSIAPGGSFSGLLGSTTGQQQALPPLAPPSSHAGSIGCGATPSQQASGVTSPMPQLNDRRTPPAAYGGVGERESEPVTSPSPVLEGVSSRRVGRAHPTNALEDSGSWGLPSPATGAHAALHQQHRDDDRAAAVTAILRQTTADSGAAVDGAAVLIAGQDDVYRCTIPGGGGEEELMGGMGYEEEEDPVITSDEETWGIDHHVEPISFGATRVKPFNPRAEYLFTGLQVVAGSMSSFVHGAVAGANATAAFVILYDAFAERVLGEPELSFRWSVGPAMFGLAIGASALGARLMKTVGVELVTLTPARGWSIQVGATLVTMILTGIGIPVSLSQSQIGAAIGCGVVDAGKKGVSWSLVAKIVSGWIITLFVSAATTGFLFYWCSKAFLAQQREKRKKERCGGGRATTTTTTTTTTKTSGDRATFNDGINFPSDSTTKTNKQTDKQ